MEKQKVFIPVDVNDRSDPIPTDGPKSRKEYSYHTTFLECINELKENEEAVGKPINELTHLPKSTENLSKIANKDEWLNEVRGNEGFKNDIAERILDKLYSPKMHWKCVNRKNVLKAMEEFAKQYSDSKLSELEKWIDTYTEFFEFSSSQLKDKIKSLKQQS